MRRLGSSIAIVIVFLLTMISGATSSYAYGTPFGHWSYSTTSTTQASYCVSGTVSAHTSWPSFISSDVGKWNAVTGAHQVHWSPGPGGCAIIFNTGNVGDCGVTNWSISGGVITSATSRYNTGTAYWRGTDTGGCNFDYTTLHEFGHANGLAHSTLTTAVMYGTDNAKTSYQADDINAIRANYH